MTYKISVIIPVYNAMSYLEAAFQSLKKQTIGFENLQVIFSDDISSDGSYEWAQRLSKQYENVVSVQTERNSGSASAPRNLALKYVEAPYVMFLDNDDQFDPDACKVLYDEIEKTGFDIIAGCYSEIHYDKKIRAVSYYDSVPARDFDFVTEMPQFRPIADPFWSKIFKVSILRENHLQFESNLYGEDTLFLLQYLVCCKTGRHVKKNIYNYRIRDNSLFHVFDKEHVMGALVGDQKIRETLLGAGQEKYYKDYLQDHLSQMMDVIANAERLADEDIDEVMRAWRPYFDLAVEYDLELKTPYAEILLADVREGRPERLTTDMLALRSICREKNKALQDVLTSKSWKLITKINRLLRR